MLPKWTFFRILAHCALLLLLKSLTLNVPQANFKKRTTMQCNVHFSNIISLLTRESGFVEPRNLIFFTEMMLNDLGRYLSLVVFFFHVQLV